MDNGPWDCDSGQSDWRGHLCSSSIERSLMEQGKNHKEYQGSVPTGVIIGTVTSAYCAFDFFEWGWWWWREWQTRGKASLFRAAASPALASRAEAFLS